MSLFRNMKTKISSLNHLFFFSLFSILLHAISVHSQSSTSPLSTSSVLMSDVIHDVFQPQLILSFKQSIPETCKETYGFLPCTNTVLGNLFLIFGYGYFMFLAARYLSTGSELLLEILGPGLVGGLFLPIISVLPEALLILVSGLSGSKETAETQVLVGMGMLAGSAIILLTLLWGSCVAVGKTDIDGSTTIDKRDTKGFSSTGSGVSVDIWTSYCARIMILSVIPFIIVQLPQILTLSYGRRQAVLISLIVTVVFLISYCLYQVFQPWMQQRKLAYVRHKHVISGILGHIKERAHGKLLSDDGEPNDDIIRKVFTAIDLNEDGLLAKSEIRAFLIGLRIEEVDLEHDDSAGIMLRDFNTSGTGYIDVTEFVKGISKWLNEARRSVTLSLDRGPDGMTFIDRFHEQTKHEYNLLRGDQSAEILEGTENSKWVTTKAILFLFLGVVIAAAFADPLVNTVKNFSTGTSIPSFFVSFIALPLVTNSSECVSALISASQKKKRTSSLTYSEIYGSVTIHNLLCLTVFLAIVYVRDLT